MLIMIPVRMQGFIPFGHGSSTMTKCAPDLTMFVFPMLKEFVLPSKGFFARLNRARVELLAMHRGDVAVKVVSSLEYTAPILAM